MNAIKNSSNHISSIPIVVIIKSNRKSIKSLTIIDLPGQENNITNHSSVATLKKMNDEFLSRLQSHDIVILVKDGQSQIANDHLYTNEFLDKFNGKKC